VWGWIPARLLDAEELERGLNRLDEQRERDIQPQQERLVLIDELIAKAERKVKRLAAAFAAESDDIIANAYQAELKAASREREALVTERQELVTTMTAGRLSISDRQMVLRAAEDIRRKFGPLSFEQ
jgi:predicted  nucleic acid-binding Zn-ribbon protein